MLADDRSENTFSYYEFLQHLKTQVKWKWGNFWQRMCAGSTLMWRNWTKYQCYLHHCWISNQNQFISCQNHPDSAYVWNSKYSLACVQSSWSSLLLWPPRWWVMADWCWHMPKHMSDNVGIAFDFMVALLAMERLCTGDIAYNSGPSCEKVSLKVLHFVSDWLPDLLVFCLVPRLRSPLDRKLP